MLLNKLLIYNYLNVYQRNISYLHLDKLYLINGFKACFIKVGITCQNQLIL